LKIAIPKYNLGNYVTLVLLHIGLGLVLYLYLPLSKIIFLCLMVYFIGRIILAHDNNKTREILLASAYFVGIEVLFRMTKAGVSYEASKYLVILFMAMGMFFKGVSGKGYPYFIYLILLVPSIVVASITLSFDATFRTNIAFVLSGPVCLGMAAIYCYDRKVSQKLIMEILLYIALPTIALTTYLFLYTPSVKDVLSNTASNSATSGGFGPNQVATSLGLGMFIMVVRLFISSPSMVLKYLNMTIFVAMTFRAFVTFSRGGVVAAVIVSAVFLGTLFFKSSYKQKNQIIGSLILFGLAASIAWIISSNQTLGLLDKRYANEDSQGREKQDLATGRVDLFVNELEGFLRRPFLGVGASRTKDIRVEEGIGHLPSHNEIGRLLGEHGLFGIIVLTILILKPLGYRSTNKKNIFFYAFLAFWFATINHTGMRIAAPSFIYALALLNVSYEKRPVYRKQINK
jgi:hypothetical protein